MYQHPQCDDNVKLANMVEFPSINHDSGSKHYQKTLEG